MLAILSSSLRRLFQGHAAAGKKDATLESLKPKVGGPDQRSSPVRCPLPAQDISLFRDLLDDASWKGLDSLKTCVCHRSTLSRSKKCILTSRVSEKQEWMSSRRRVMPEPIPKQFLDTHCELRLLFSWLARSGDPQASARDLCFVAIALAKLRPSSLMCHNISHSM